MREDVSAPVVPAAGEIPAGYALDLEEVAMGDASVRVFTVPESTAPAAHAVVCLPGLGASGRSFAPMRPLSNRHRLIMWTPPFNTPQGVTPLAHNLALLDHPAAPLPQRFALVASSYGTLIAAAFALAHPERVTALVLVSPVLSTRRIRLPALVATAAMQVPLPLAYFFAPLVARALGGPHLPAEARTEIVREARQIPTVELVRRLRDIVSGNRMQDLPALSMPVQVVHGSRDVIVPLSAARDVQARIPNARLDVIRRAAHLPYMSHARAFNAVVGTFLDSALAAGRPAPPPTRTPEASP